MKAPYRAILIVFLFAILLGCSEYEKPQGGGNKWEGKRQVLRFIEERDFPDELVYPNGQYEYATTQCDGSEEVIAMTTRDKIEEIVSYYKRIPPKLGWVLDGESIDEEYSFLRFKKQDFYAGIHIKVGDHNKNNISIVAGSGPGPFDE